MNICSWVENNEEEKDLDFGILRNARKPKKKKFILLQYTAAISACLTTAGLGCVLCWTSPAIPHLISNNSEFPVSINQSAWIASLISLGMIIGFILAPLLTIFIRPKGTLLLLSVPQLTSWILIILGKNYIILLIARFIGGFGYGAGLCATSAYLREIGDINSRGSFVTLIKVVLNSGVFFTLVIGAYLPYHAMNLVHLSVPIFFILSFSLMPDSSYFSRNQDSDEIEEMGEEMKNLMKPPGWLKPDLDPRFKLESGLKLGSESKSESSLKAGSESGLKSGLLPGSEQGLQLILKPELKPDSISDSKLESRKQKIQKAKSQSRNKFHDVIKSWKKLLTIRSNIKALCIIILICAIENLSGYTVILTYTQQIMAFSEFSLAPEKATIVLTTFKIVGSIACSQIVEKIERRSLILISGLSAALIQGLVGLFFFFKFYTGIDTTFVKWLPFFGISMYGIALTSGISGLYYVFQAEFLSDDVKGPGVAFTNIAYELLAFLIKSQFYKMIDGVGIYMTFWIFAIFGCCGTLIAFYISPETKGKSLEEIQMILKLERNGRRRKWFW